MSHLVATVLVLALAAGPAQPETIPACCAAKLSWSDLNGREIRLDGYRGRIVVLNFWATWCLPCREEMPDLVAIQNRYGIYGVQVVGASADEADQRAAVVELSRELELNFPVVLGADSEQMGVLGLDEAIPATVILDPEGRVVKRFSGLFEREELEGVLDGLVERDEPVRSAAAKHDQDHGHRHDGAGGASLVPS